MRHRSINLEEVYATDVDNSWIAPTIDYMENVKLLDNPKNWKAKKKRIWY